jgi:hypothetical protein
MIYERSDDCASTTSSGETAVSISSISSFETLSEASFDPPEDESEVDISAYEMSKVFKAGRHRVPVPHSLRRNPSGYRDALVLGTGSSSGLRATLPRVQRNTTRGLNSRADDIIHGTGSGTGLRAVSHKSGPLTSRTEPVRRVITGVFVTRLEPKSTVYQVQALVKRETGMEVRPEKLQAKYGTYASFYIRGDKRLQDRLLCAEMWPKGTLLKRFIEKAN